MRFPRVKAEGQSFYQCVSRCVDGLVIFGTSRGRCLEAEEFLSLMRRLAAFTGIRVLDYLLMADHFHLVCNVPAPKFLTQSELLTRIEAGYGPQRAQTLHEQLASYAQQPDRIEQSNRLLEPYRRRMYDLSTFIKALKGRFAQEYNQRHKRYGVLWAERFKSVLLEGGQAVTAITTHIELNPVRAGLCEDPKDYPYCGYAEAIAKGAAIALEGLRTILGLPQTASREEVGRKYRKLLYSKGAMASGSNPPTFYSAAAQRGRRARFL